ncbi:MAG: hypothetical protein GF334_09895, partial [Candidatus Altiarchaeales archaeon]|nr:hypothetical protein [Candidatus Altiarchaeales archaeon]
MGNNRARKSRKVKRARTQARKERRLAEKKAAEFGWTGFLDDFRKTTEQKLPGDVLHWFYEEAWKLASWEEIQEMKKRFPGQDWVRAARRNNYDPPGWAGNLFKRAQETTLLSRCASLVGTMIRLGTMDSGQAKKVVEALLRGDSPTDLGPGITWAQNLNQKECQYLYDVGLEIIFRGVEERHQLDRELDYNSENWRFDLLWFCKDLDEFASIHNVLHHSDKC